MQNLGPVLALILIIAAGAALTMLRQKVSQAAATALTTKVIMRGQHVSGQFHVSEKMQFRTATDAASVLRSVTEKVNLPTGAQNAVIGDLFIESTGASFVTFASGSRLGTHFAAALTVQEVEGGCTGQYEVRSWHTTNGIVTGQKQMTYLRAKVAAGVRAADPAAQIEGDRETASA